MGHRRMTKIDHATLVRMKDTATRAHRIASVSHTYLATEIAALASADIAASLRSDPGLTSDHADRLHAGCRALATTSIEIAALTERISTDLDLLCQLTTDGAILSSGMRAAMSQLVATAPRTSSPVVDLRHQRLSRMPLDAALCEVMASLDQMCVEIGALTGALQKLAPARLIAQG